MMGDISSILKILDAGGNAAMIALFFLMWRFDRRLLKMEIVIGQLLKDREGPAS